MKEKNIYVYQNQNSDSPTVLNSYQDTNWQYKFLKRNLNKSIVFPISHHSFQTYLCTTFLKSPQKNNY